MFLLNFTYKLNYISSTLIVNHHTFLCNRMYNLCIKCFHVCIIVDLLKSKIFLYIYQYKLLHYIAETTYQMLLKRTPISNGFQIDE